MTAFSCHMAVSDETAILYLAGDIDIAAAEPMAEAGLKLLHDHGVRALIVDCSSVGFCDSTGLGILVTWHQDAALQRKSLRVRAMPERMDKIVRLTGLDEVLQIEAGAASGPAAQPLTTAPPVPEQGPGAD